MKITHLLPLLLFGTLFAQEIATTRATLIVPIIREVIEEKPPEPLLRFDIAKDSIIESKTLINDGQKITLQKIEPIALPPLSLLTPLALPTAEQLARLAELAKKAQQHRTVKVAVHLIASVLAGLPNDPPNLLPTQAQIKAKLDAVFGPQVNAWFEVRMVEPEAIAFDTADANSFFGFTIAAGSPVPVPGNRILDIKNWISAELSTAIANSEGDDDIDVHIIGGATPFHFYQTSSANEVAVGAIIVGEADIQSGKNRCIVDGDRDRQNVDENNIPTGYYYPASSRTVTAVLDTIAHEIGHLVVSDGHPDEGSGPAILVGTDRTKRLMSSGSHRLPGASLLVKKEWDAAEVWLNLYPDVRYRKESSLEPNEPIGNY